MPDRLNELRRQRALVAEHLAWLDREIAAESGSPAPRAHPEQATRVEGPAPLVAPASAPALRPTPLPLMPQAPAPAAALDPEMSAQAAADADALLEQYRVAPDALKTDVRTGCFLYFFAAMALLALGVIGLYFYFRHGK